MWCKKNNNKWQFYTTEFDVTGLNVTDLNVTDLNVTGLNVTDLNETDLNVTDLNVTDLNVCDLNVTEGTCYKGYYDCYNDTRCPANQAHIREGDPIQTKYAFSKTINLLYHNEGLGYRLGQTHERKRHTCG